MKRYIFNISPGIIKHIFLLVIFAFLPFIFSDKLIETETTFRFIVLGALLAVFFPLLYFFQPVQSKKKLPSLTGNYFYLLLLLYLIYQAFACSKSLNRGEAIYDLLKLYTITGYFFILVFFLKNDDGFLPLLLKYTNVSVIIFAVIALSQIGLQLKYTNGIKVDYMLSSSLGNKNFYAETMALMLPLIITSAIILCGRWRAIAIGNVSVILITIIMLQTLSAWLVFAFWIMLAPLLFIYLKKYSLLPKAGAGSKSRVTIILPLVVVVLCASLLYRSTHFNQIGKRVDKIIEYAKNNKGYKYEDTYHTNSIAERLFLWKNAWHMFRDYPVTGAGLDNWKIYNTRYELPFSRYIMNNNVRYIRPHNDLLLTLAEEGIAGFIIFAALFIGAFTLAVRLIHNGKNQTVLILSATGLFTYLIIACVSLPGDRFYTQIILFLYFAVICANYELNFTPQNAINQGWALLSLLFITSGISIAYIGSKRYAAEVHLIYALQAQAKKDWQKMSYHSAMAKNYFFPLDYTATPIAWYQGMAAFNSGSPAIAKLYFEEALRSNPYDLNVINDLATATQREGNNEKAMKTYDEALALAPYFSDAFLNKAVLIYNMGNREQAYQYLHTYPLLGIDENYNHILFIMCTNKVIDAINDTIVSNYYLGKKPNLLKIDSVAIAQHVPFEKLVLQDSILLHLPKAPEWWSKIP